ncbi:MAG: phosphoribosylaminoimidazolesuccinocarboxamide synthase [Mycobacteriales bacterium]
MSTARLTDLPLRHRGKVRELYELPGERLLMVASDRISAFDFVLEPAIPDKGRVLTQLSLWWFDRLAELAPNHVLPAAAGEIPVEAAGRAVVCERLSMVPVECVARGYLTGSGLADYHATGTVCGVPLPAGLEDGARLPEPIFTPTTKAPVGEHDEPMTWDDVVTAVGPDLAVRLRELTLRIYAAGATVTARAGIILADTKVELGRRADGTLVIADELLTPDSSRFWPADSWQPGRAQPSFDKQPVRDWLAGGSGWDRTGGTPPPALPADVVAGTRARYLEAFERVTGTSLPSAG